ncbi:MAG: transposase [Eubacterium sp.]|nr:transposase [Eubacterium sp.]
MLKGIRVQTKEELVQRIYKYFDEANELPVVYHWKCKLGKIDPSEKTVVDTLPVQKSS